MSNTVPSVIAGGAVREDELEKRIFRSMALAVAIAVIVGSFMGPWRVTTGLLLGGLLSLVNYRWLRGTVVAILNVDAAGQKPRPKIWKHAFRYLIIAGAVFAAYQLNLVSLPATLAGLCSFVVALFVEAFRQFYFAVISREESF
jgi:drug/metabolite transporter (DMT)-like permease